ncbi:MAG TPA: response regulator transcription factor [Stellaceae bacterium]
MAKLAILDPSGLFRAALLSLLQNLGFDDLTEAANLDELAARAGGDAKPDILLINLTRGDDAVDRTMGRVRAILPDAKVVFLARGLDLDLLAAVFVAGASGYLLENTSRDALGKSLTLVNAGGTVFPPELASFIPHLAARRPAPASPVTLSDGRLSEREIEILQCLTQGRSNKAIGHALDIAEATVKVHVKRILRKIAVANRTQAALWVAARGLAMVTGPSGMADLGSVAGRASTR